MCDFDFDFGETPADPPMTPSSLNGTVWECPHEPISETGRCVFHSSPDDTPEGVAQERLIDELRSEGPTNIYGAVFDDLSLRYQNLRADTRHPIDLSHITVEGTLDLTNAVVDRPLILGYGSFNRIKLDDAYFIDEVRFQCSTFEGDVTLTGTECRSIVEFSEADFEGNVDLSGGIFRDSVYFDEVSVGSFSAEGTDFYATISLRQTTFEHECSFKKASVDGDVQVSFSSVAAPAKFNEVSVSGAVYSNRSAFDSDCLFNYATIEEGIHLNQGKVDGRLSFAGANVGEVLELSEIALADAVVFDDAKIDGEIRMTESALEAVLRFDDATVTDTVRLARTALRNSVSFDRATVEGTIDLRDATIAEHISLQEATVEEEINLSGTTIVEHISLQGATVGHFELYSATLSADISFRAAELDSLRVADVEIDSSAVRIDATGGTLASGSIEIGGKPLLWLDCQGTTLGKVVLISADNRPVFEYLRIQNTTFDGFDFTAHRSDLVQAEFILHTVPPVSANEISRLSPTEREVTYLKAKQGATAIEDGVARREFFTRQMQARRQHYFERLRTGSSANLSTRLKVLPRWVTGWFLSITCGYGERPNRVLSISSIMIVLYGFAYHLTGVVADSSRVFDAFLLSLQSFIALIIGPPETVGRLGTILVISEAFFGAIFLSLFVVTLTRAFDVGSG